MDALGNTTGYPCNGFGDLLSVTDSKTHSLTDKCVVRALAMRLDVANREIGGLQR